MQLMSSCSTKPCRLQRISGRLLGSTARPESWTRSSGANSVRGSSSSGPSTSASEWIVQAFVSHFLSSAEVMFIRLLRSLQRRRVDSDEWHADIQQRPRSSHSKLRLCHSKPRQKNQHLLQFNRNECHHCKWTVNVLTNFAKHHISFFAVQRPHPKRVQHDWSADGLRTRRGAGQFAHRGERRQLGESLELLVDRLPPADSRWPLIHCLMNNTLDNNRPSWLITPVVIWEHRAMNIVNDEKPVARPSNGWHWNKPKSTRSIARSKSFQSRNFKC